MYLLKYTLSNVSTNVLFNMFIPKCPDPKIYSQKKETLTNGALQRMAINTKQLRYNELNQKN